MSQHKYLDENNLEIWSGIFILKFKEKFFIQIANQKQF